MMTSRKVKLPHYQDFDGDWLSIPAATVHYYKTHNLSGVGGFKKKGLGEKIF